jgi:hypothetical protein
MSVRRLALMITAASVRRVDFEIMLPKLTENCVLFVVVTPDT